MICHEIKIKPHKYHSMSLYLIQSEKGSYDGIVGSSIPNKPLNFLQSFVDPIEKKKTNFIFIHLISLMISAPMHCFSKLARTLFIRM